MADSELTAAGKRLAAHRERLPATCVECGAAIEGTRRRRYCSPACSGRAWRRAQHDPDPSVGEPAPARCTVCGAEMHTARVTRRYCSLACKQLGYRQRRAVNHPPLAPAESRPARWGELMAAYAQAHQRAAHQQDLLLAVHEQLVVAQDRLAVSAQRTARTASAVDAPPAERPVRSKEVA